MSVPIRNQPAQLHTAATEMFNNNKMTAYNYSLLIFSTITFEKKSFLDVQCSSYRGCKHVACPFAYFLVKTITARPCE